MDRAIYPEEVTWCLVQRSDQPRTSIRPASPEQAWESIMLNSLHDDEPQVWMENLAQIQPLVEMARFYHLALGAGGAGVVEALLAFWDGG
jgi:hypothetical protein